MINWVIIFAIAIIALIIVRIKHFKHKIFAIGIILLLVFFYVTYDAVFAGQDINLKTFEGIVSFAKIYFSWLWHAFGNAKVLTGNALKMDWVGNETIQQVLSG